MPVARFLVLKALRTSLFLVKITSSSCLVCKPSFVSNLIFSCGQGISITLENSFRSQVSRFLTSRLGSYAMGHNVEV
jgi:hypothetical protein